MKKTVFVLILLLFTSGVFGQSNQIDWLQVHNLCMQGINGTFDLNPETAKECFDKVIAMAPGDPRGYFLNCILYYFKYMIGRNKTDFDQFFIYSDKVIQVCEDLLDQNKKDYTSKFYLAGIYGYRGLMYQFDNSIFKAVWDGKKGFGMLKDIIEEKPDTYDAYMGTGLFDYMVAHIPKGFRWVLKVLGYGGDTERGLSELKTAEEKGIYTRSEAAMWLSQFLFAEKKYDEAFFYIKKLIKDYPNNSLFLLMYAQMEIGNGKPDNAISSLKKAIEINTIKNKEIGKELPYILLADVLFRSNDFKDANKYFDLYLNKIPSKENIHGYYLYSYGLSLELTGEREKAIVIYKLCKNAEVDKEPDKAYYFNLCQDRISNPINENQKMIIVAGNIFSLNRFEDALIAYKNALTNENLTSDEKIVGNYYLGRCYFEKKMYDDALISFNSALKINSKLFQYLIPHCYYRIGQTLAKLDRKVEAKLMFKKVYDFDHYLFRKSLEERVDEELDKLK